MKMTIKERRISFTEDVEPDFVSKTETQFSGFRLTLLI